MIKYSCLLFLELKPLLLVKNMIYPFRCLFDASFSKNELKRFLKFTLEDYFINYLIIRKYLICCDAKITLIQWGIATAALFKLLLIRTRRTQFEFANTESIFDFSFLLILKCYERAFSVEEKILRCVVLSTSFTKLLKCWR